MSEQEKEHFIKEDKLLQIDDPTVNAYFHRIKSSLYDTDLALIRKIFLPVNS